MAVAQGSSGPATVTVRVRTLVLATIILAALAALAYGLYWVTSLRALSVGSGGWGAIGLHHLRGTTGNNDTGPPDYRWTRNGEVIYSLEVYNTASVPIRIDGIPATTADIRRSAAYTPILMLAPNPFVGDITKRAPFHPVTISAGGSAGLVFVFRSNPGACHAPWSPDSSSTQDSVTLRTTVLGVFHGTQSIALPQPLDFNMPTKADCAAP